MELLMISLEKNLWINLTSGKNCSGIFWMLIQRPNIQIAKIYARVTLNEGDEKCEKADSKKKEEDGEQEVVDVFT